MTQGARPDARATLGILLASGRASAGGGPGTLVEPHAEWDAGQWASLASRSRSMAGVLISQGVPHFIACVEAPWGFCEPDSAAESGKLRLHVLRG